MDTAFNAFYEALVINGNNRDAKADITRLANKIAANDRQDSRKRKTIQTHEKVLKIIPDNENSIKEIAKAIRESDSYDHDFNELKKPEIHQNLI